MKTSWLGALGLVVLSTGAAMAHAHLVSEEPAANASVSPAPAALTLTFSEAVELRFTGVALAGPGGDAVATGTATLAPGDGSTLMVPLAGKLAAGSYTITWHALSKDGHRTTGSYSFTVN